MTERRRTPLRVIVFVAVMLAILAAVAAVPLAVGHFRPQPAPETVSGPVLRVIPSELFEGELKRLEPHMGLSVHGRVLLQPVEMEKSIFVCYRTEIRRPGQEPQDLGRVKSRVENPTELSVSVRELVSPTPDRKYDLVTAVQGEFGGSRSTQYLWEFFPQAKGVADGYSTSPCHLRQPRELGEREQMPVWGWVCNPATGLHVTELEKVIQSDRTALIIYLWWERAD